MPPRPYWKGHMRLSLVTFAVALYPVINSSAKLAFHQVQRSTGARIHEQKVGIGQNPVPPEDIAKGYEVEKGRYVLMEDEDFEKVRIATRRSIDLETFFPAGELDPLYIDKPYYVVPDGTVAEEAFTVIREALAHDGRCGLGRVVLSGRERLVSLAPRDQGLILYTLHSADMVRKPGAYFADIRSEIPDSDEISVAEALIARKTGHFDPERFVDRYQEGLKRVIDAKVAGQTPPIIEEREPANVVDLMEVLKRSLEQENSDASIPPRPAGNTATRRPGPGTAMR